ncbi:MAG: hypothetical protein U1E61_18305 [Bradyrhizobium sp.]
MKNLTIAGLIAIALLSTILALPFVQSSPANSSKNAISVSDSQRQDTAMKETKVADYSLVFPEDPSAARK